MIGFKLKEHASFDTFFFGRRRRILHELRVGYLINCTNKSDVMCDINGYNLMRCVGERRNAEAKRIERIVH